MSDPIARYNIATSPDTEYQAAWGYMDPDATGDYVNYDDHLAAMQAKDAEIRSVKNDLQLAKLALWKIAEAREAKYDSEEGWAMAREALDSFNYHERCE